MAVSAASVSPASAQTREPPYFASIRASATTLNMRVGPSMEFRISWVYRRPGLPVRVLRVKDAWRLIEDPDGTTGWVRASLLSPDRSVYVRGGEPAPLRSDASDAASVRWRLEEGVSARLLRCDANACQIDAAGHRGWVDKSRLWGV